MSAIATATAKASRAITAFQKMGPIVSMGPTPQRLLRAGGLAEVEVARDSQGSEAAMVRRIRVTATPLEQMAKRRRLDADPLIAAAMLSAGRRYLGLWFRAGLAPLKGQDPGKIRSTAVFGGLMVGPDDLLGSERHIEVFRQYRAAHDAMSADKRRAVDAIVLHEYALVDAGAKIDPMTTDRASRITLASTVLRKGLVELALHFGMIAEPPVSTVDDLPPGMPPEMADILAAMDAKAAASA